MRPCFNCGELMTVTGERLSCPECDVSETAEVTPRYRNPVTAVLYADVCWDPFSPATRIFYIDHSAEHVPSPG